MHVVDAVIVFVLADIFSNAPSVFQRLRPKLQVLRVDFSSLGAQPIVASVGASDLRLAGDHRAWDISWVSIPGNTMESANFSCAGNNITAAYTGEGVYTGGKGICTTSIIAAAAGGSPVSGSFTLTTVSTSNGSDAYVYGGASETTESLAFNATSSQVRAALEALGGVATADVELLMSLPGSRGGGSTYLVTFPGASGASSPFGGLSVTASSAGLNGTGVAATVREVYPGSRWGGEFGLSLGGLQGSSLPFDANAKDVQEVVDALIYSVGGEAGGVTVQREEVEAGYRWAVTFSGGDGVGGNMDLMEVSSGWMVVTVCFMNICYS